MLITKTVHTHTQYIVKVIANGFSVPQVEWKENIDMLIVSIIYVFIAYAVFFRDFHL